MSKEQDRKTSLSSNSLPKRPLDRIGDQATKYGPGGREQSDRMPRTTDQEQPVPLQPQTQAVVSYETCITHTVDVRECKDCCDMLEINWQTRKACRDACVAHDFSQNTQFILVDVVSVLGPEGDYSMCTVGNDEKACKACCDSSDDLAGGDRRFCRNACVARNK